MITRRRAASPHPAQGPGPALLPGAAAIAGGVALGKTAGGSGGGGGNHRALQACARLRRRLLRPTADGAAVGVDDDPTPGAQERQCQQDGARPSAPPQGRWSVIHKEFWVERSGCPLIAA